MSDQLNEIFEMVKTHTVESLKKIDETEYIDVTLVDQGENTLLHIVARYNPGIEVMKYLLSKGADINAKNSDGETPLHFAAMKGAYGENEDSDLNAEDNYDDTDPQNLLEKNRTEFENLDNEDTETGSVSKIKTTPLTHIITMSGINIEFLISKGAEVNAKNNDGFTPLHFAVWNDASIEVIKCLVSKGADVNVQANNGNTPLHHIHRAGESIEVIELLLTKTKDINLPNQDGDTVLHLVAKCVQNLSVIELLTNKGAKVNVKNKDGETPLHKAARSNANFEVLEYLIKQGAKILERENSGWTPLHITCRSNPNNEIITYLTENGSKINEKSDDGWTPLHLAVYYAVENREDISRIKYLIKRGADIEAKNNWGITPQNLMTWNGINAPKSGCYIATAVYGSYEAPQVITLRRFRDEVLATSYLGCLFIKTYYRFSPPVAERLKGAKSINLVVRKVLDRVVKRLNQQV